MSELGMKMYSWRMERGLTQEQSANQCGICKNTWSKIENGETQRVTKDSAEKITSATGIAFLPGMIIQPQAAPEKRERFLVRKLERAVPDEWVQYIREILDWRNARDMSFTAFCKATNVTCGQLSKFERGIKKLSQNCMTRIKELTGIEPLPPEAMKQKKPPVKLESDSGDDYMVVRIIEGKQTVLFHTSDKHKAKAVFTKLSSDGAMVRVAEKQKDGTHRILPMWEADRRYFASEYYKAKSVLIAR